MLRKSKKNIYFNTKYVLTQPVGHRHRVTNFSGTDWYTCPLDSKHRQFLKSQDVTIGCPEVRCDYWVHIMLSEM